MRVCAQPGCPTLTTTTRCLEHRRQQERARGTRQQRGYDRAHELLRAHWAPIVAKGMTSCARCGGRISPLQAWHLDHTDDRQGYLGPSHRSCNVRAPRAAGVVAPPPPGG